MKLQVIAAGRLKPGPEKSLAEDYLTRAQGLGRKCGISRIAVTEFNESQASSAASRMAEEGRIIAGALPAKCFTVVLDERGTALRTQALAAVRAQMGRAAQEMVRVAIDKEMRDGGRLSSVRSN